MSYVALAYGIAVVVIGGYVWSVARRRRAVERELADLGEGRPGSKQSGGAPR